ncbi:DUF6243 family protein [Streptomyces albidoflavus]|uniref:DUF6243 family protein n=1 Tax=Streptomyces albidoflavus TaxID=1886 RepID=UPI00386B710F|nr:DUF6243 family protein [Streptomyces albidoflavus]
MAKSRNNLLGVGGQRNKLPRNGRPGGVADNRPAALDQKQELLRKMRERTAAASADTPAEAPEAERDEATQEAGGNA